MSFHATTDSHGIPLMPGSSVSTFRAPGEAYAGMREEFHIQRIERGVMWGKVGFGGESARLIPDTAHPGQYFLKREHYDTVRVGLTRTDQHSQGYAYEIEKRPVFN